MSAYQQGRAAAGATTPQTGAYSGVDSNRPQGGTFRYDPSLPRPDFKLREREILCLLCNGLTNEEIATKLTMSREAIKSELKRLYNKLDVANRTQAAVLLVKQGWI
jgi:DNA-binding NarL/FixJ family response regulator